MHGRHNAEVVNIEKSFEDVNVLEKINRLGAKAVLKFKLGRCCNGMGCS